MRERISAALSEAQKAQDQTRLCTLRLITAAIKDRDIAARGADDSSGGVSDEEVIRILGQMIRQREDSVRAYEEAGRLELAEREREEIKIIREFLPGRSTTRRSGARSPPRSPRPRPARSATWAR